MCTIKVTSQITTVESQRIFTNLSLMYSMEENSGNTVHDVVEYDGSQDATVTQYITLSSNVTNGGFANFQCVIANCNGYGIFSINPLTSLTSSIAQTNTFTIEFWFQTSSVSFTSFVQSFVSISGDSTCVDKDVFIGQQGTYFWTKLTVNSDILPSCGVSYASITNATNCKNVIVQASFRYINGTEILQFRSPFLPSNVTLQYKNNSSPLGLSSWNTAYSLALGNDIGGDKRWNGQMYLFAVYNRYLSDAELHQNYIAGTKMSLTVKPQTIYTRLYSEIDSYTPIILDVFDPIGRSSLQFLLITSPLYGNLYYYYQGEYFPIFSDNIINLPASNTSTSNFYTNASNTQFVLYYSAPFSIDNITYYSPTSSILNDMFYYKIFGRDVATTPDNTINGATVVNIAIDSCVENCGRLSSWFNQTGNVTGVCENLGALDAFCQCSVGFLGYDCQYDDICELTCVHGTCLASSNASILQHTCVCNYGYVNANCSQSISSATNSRVYVSPSALSANVANNVTVNVLIYDVFDNLQPAQVDNVTISLLNSITNATIPIWSQPPPQLIFYSPGNYTTVVYNFSKTGSYRIIATLNSVVIPSSFTSSTFFTVVAGVIYPPLCKVGVTLPNGFISLPSHLLTTFDIISVDAYNNVRLYNPVSPLPIDFIVSVYLNSNTSMIYTTNVSLFNENTNESLTSIGLPLSEESLAGFEVLSSSSILNITWNLATSSYIVDFLSWASGNFTITVSAVSLSSSSSFLSFTNLTGFPRNILRYNDPIITSVIPSVGSVAGNTKVIINGVNFYSGYSACIFNTTALSVGSTQYINSTQLICFSPVSSHSGQVPFYITNNYRATLSNLAYYYYNDPLSLTISPTQSNFIGGQIILLTPTNPNANVFYDNPSVSPYCLINGVSVPAVIIDTSHATCVTPPFWSITVETSVSFDYTTNNQEFASQIQPISLVLVNPASPSCLQTSELSFEANAAAQADQIYFPNLATTLPNVSIVTNAGNPLLWDNSSGIIDGDLCCYPTATQPNPHFCGVAFLQNNSALTSVEVNLNKMAFVNEFLTSWYDPCVDQPLALNILYWDYEVTNNWKLIMTAYMDSTLASEAKALSTPCSSIPSVEGQVSICISFFNPVLSDKFLISFNNSAAMMGSYPFQTDGGWLFEFEVHGILQITPYTLLSNVSIITIGSHNNTIAAAIAISQYNFANVLLPFASSAVYVRPLPSSSSVIFFNDVASTNYAIPNAQGLAVFNNLVFHAVPVGIFQLEFYIPGVVQDGVMGNTVVVDVNITIGIATYLLTLHPNSFSLISSPSVTIPTFTINAFDDGGNFVGSLDQVVGRIANVSIYSYTADGNSWYYYLPNFVTLSGGSTSQTMVDGEATFNNNIQLISPPSGTYVLIISAHLLASSYVSLTVTFGTASFLQAFPSGSLIMPCNPTVSVPQIYIGVYDTQYNYVSNYASVIYLTASSNSNGYLQGSMIQSMVNGYASFDDLTFTAPPPELYVFAFTSPSLIGLDLNVTIVVGPPQTIVAVSEISLTRSYPSAPLVNITPPLLVVKAYDASGTFVSGNDTVVRVAQLRFNPLASSPNLSPSLTLSGTVSLNMIHGVVIFSSLSLPTPLVGSYIFDIIVSSGSFQLPTISFQFTITLGVPVALLTSVPLPGLLVYSAKTTFLTPGYLISITVVDAGNNPLGTSNNISRVVTMNISDTKNLGIGLASTSGSPVQKIAINADTTSFAGLALNSPVTSATWTACASSGGTCTVPVAAYVSYSSTTTGVSVIKSVTGSIVCSITAFGSDPDPFSTKSCYYATTSVFLNFTSLSLQSILIPVVILPGQPQSIGVNYNKSSINSITPSLFTSPIGSVVIDAYDAAGSFVGSFDTVSRSAIAEFSSALITVNGVPTISYNDNLIGTTTGTMLYGVCSISGMALETPVAGVYNISVFVPSISITLPTYFTITIVSGPPYQLQVVYPLTSINSPNYYSIAPFVFIDAIVIGMLDAGGNMWDMITYASQPTDKSVTVMIASDSLQPVDGSITTLYGVTNQNLDASGGTANFTGLYLENPPFMSFTLIFSNPDLPIDCVFYFSLLPGQPIYLVTLSTQSNVISETVSSDKSVPVTFDLLFLDASQNDLAQYNTTTFAFSYDIHINASFSSDFNFFASGSDTELVGVMNQPIFYGNIPIFYPLVGTYFLTIYSIPSLTEVLLTLQVLPGVPVVVIFTDNLPSQVTNNDADAYIGAVMTVKLLDVAGNTATEANGINLEVMWVPVVSTDQVFASGDPSDYQAVVSSGLASFSQVTLIGMPGSYYHLMVFDISNSINGSLTQNSIQVTPCTDTYTAVGQYCVCSPGYFAVESQGCVACAKNYYKSDASSVEVCQQCAPNKITTSVASNSSNDCLCIEGYYSVNISSSCILCPVGAICSGGLSIHSANGYWGGKNKPDIFYKCLTPGCEADSVCEKGYEGVLCGTCSPGYGNYGTTICQQCPHSSTSAFLFFLLLFVWVGLLLATCRCVIYNVLAKMNTKEGLGSGTGGYGSPTGKSYVKTIAGFDGNSNYSSAASKRGGGGGSSRSSRTDNTSSNRDSNRSSIELRPLSNNTNGSGSGSGSGNSAAGSASVASPTSSSSSPASSAFSSGIDALVIFRLLVTYAQSIAFLSAYELPWGNHFNMYMQVASTLTMSPQIIPVHCSFRLSFYYYFLWYLLLPIVLTAFVVVVVFIIHTLTVLINGYQNRGNSGDGSGGFTEYNMNAGSSTFVSSSSSRKQTSSWFIPTLNNNGNSGGLKKDGENSTFTFYGILGKYAITCLVVIIYIIHPSVCRQIFEVFSCRHIDGKLYMSGSLINECTTSTHLVWEVLSATVLQLWIFGLPFFIFYSLIKNRYRLMDPNVMLKFHFFTAGYNLRYYYFEGVAFARRFFLVILLVFARSQPLTQIVFALLVMMLNITVLFQFKPYNKLGHLLLDFWAMVVVYLTTIGGCLLDSMDSSSHRHVEESISSILIIINAVMTTIFGIALFQVFAPEHIVRRMHLFGNQIGLNKTIEQLRFEHQSAIAASSYVVSKDSKDLTGSKAGSDSPISGGTRTLGDLNKEDDVTLFANRTNMAATLADVDTLKIDIKGGKK